MSHLNNILVELTFVIIHNFVSSIITNPNYSYGVAIIFVTLIIKIDTFTSKYKIYEIKYKNK